jgi:hypothetical protein
MPQLALDDVERDPLVREFDGVGVAQLVRREPPPHAGLGGDPPELGAGGVTRPGPAAGGPVDHAQERADRHCHPEFEPGAEVLPAPRVHADLAPAAALAVADQHRSRARLQVVLGDAERLVDAQPRPPEQHDQGPHAGAVDAVAGLAHDRDDFLDRGRIGRVAQSLVARGAAGEIAGQGHGIATAAGGIEQRHGHEASSVDDVLARELQRASRGPLSADSPRRAA